ncbi:MAG: SDR family oxidoreductase [Planctomycetes bacterium]|nr:SDR family oxidoreductase [Planctomycetota bacterium]
MNPLRQISRSDSRPILVTGAAGFIGTYLAFELAKSGKVHGTTLENAVVPELARLSNFSTSKLDVSDLDGTIKFVRELNPAAVFHAAGVANPAWCAEHPEIARRINAEGAADVAKWCAENGSKFVFFSTDQIFDGLDSPYDESSSPTPLHAYGRSKGDGEDLVRRANPDAAIARITLCYGATIGGRQSSSDWVLRTASSGKEISLFEDEFRTPVFIDDVVEAMARILETDARGILHIAGPEAVNRFEFGRRLCDSQGISTEKLKPASFRNFTQYPRAGDLRLAHDATRKILGMEFASLDEGLSRYNSHRDKVLAFEPTA